MELLPEVLRPEVHAMEGGLTSLPLSVVSSEADSETMSLNLEENDWKCRPCASWETTAVAAASLSVASSSANAYARSLNLEENDSKSMPCASWERTCGAQAAAASGWADET